MNIVKIGQRWAHKYLKFVVEVVTEKNNDNMHDVTIIQHNDHWYMNKIYTYNLENPIWELLEGQDKPND